MNADGSTVAGDDTAPPEGTAPDPATAPEHPAGIARSATGALAYAEVTLATMAVATAGLLYARFFTTRGYLLPLLGAAVLAAVLAALAAVRRWRPAVTLLALVLGIALYATFAVLPATLDHGIPTMRTASALADGLLRGWARMLTVSLPADPTADLLFTPVLLTWVTSFLTTTLILRTRAAFAPFVPIPAFVAALLFIVPRAGDNLVLTAVFVLEILLVAATRVVRLDITDLARTPGDPADRALAGSVPGRRRILGRLVFALPVVVIVAAVGAVVPAFVPVADGRDRFDPRSVVPLRFSIDDTLTPLVTLKSQLQERPARRLFTVRVDNDGGVKLDRVRTAALEDYDGALWTSGDSFLVAGRRLARDPALTGARQVAVHISIDDMPGPFVPSVGWPVLMSASGTGFSTTSGVLVSRSSSLRGMSYDVVGEIRPPDAGLNTALPTSGSFSAQDTQLPTGLPLEIQQKAAEIAAQAREPYAKLAAMESYLRRLPYSLDARPGHSYDALRRLFSSNTQDRVGYAEQYAAAFAVLARSQGFPTRVAVGYLLRPDGRRGATYTVTTADAHAWPEVHLAGYGWVPFEPTDFTQAPNSRQAPPTAQPGAEQKPADSQSSGSQAIVDPTLKNGPGARARIIAGGLIALAVLGILLVLAPLLIAAEKYRRRRRRQRGTNAARIVGAWRESTDRLVERGVQMSRALTPWEVALRAEHQLGEPAQAVGVLAPIVTAAVFAPAEPADDAVREAWELDARLRRDLRHRRGVWRTARALIDPRPLTDGWRDARRRRGAMHRLHGG